MQRKEIEKTYIHKIKHIIDDICNVINCSKTIN